MRISCTNHNYKDYLFWVNWRSWIYTPRLALRSGPWSSTTGCDGLCTNLFLAPIHIHTGPYKKRPSQINFLLSFVWIINNYIIYCIIQYIFRNNLSLFSSYYLNGNFCKLMVKRVDNSQNPNLIIAWNLFIHGTCKNRFIFRTQTFPWEHYLWCFSSHALRTKSWSRGDNCIKEQGYKMWTLTHWAKD